MMLVRCAPALFAGAWLGPDGELSPPLRPELLDLFNPEQSIRDHIETLLCMVWLDANEAGKLISSSRTKEVTFYFSCFHQC